MSIRIDVVAIERIIIFIPCVLLRLPTTSYAATKWGNGNEMVMIDSEAGSRKVGRKGTHYSCACLHEFNLGDEDNDAGQISVSARARAG